MEQKLLTIAIPTYNRANYLKRALGSIIDQYDERVEIIVSDNASEDNTQQVVEEMSLRAPILYNKNEHNMGFDGNFLQCYRLASGKFILLMGDDDVIIEHRLAVILQYLEENPRLSAVFMNHNFSQVGLVYGWRPESANSANITKHEFLDYAQYQITFISCLLLSRERFQEIEDPERFFGTYFFHTCILFNATKQDDSRLGVIGCYCVTDDLERQTDKQPTEPAKAGKFYEIFGKGAECAVCTVGAKCGYDPAQLAKLRKAQLQMFPRKIIVFKAETNGFAQEAFYEYAYPVIKKYPAIYWKTMLATLIPNWIARLLNRYARPAYRIKIRLKAILNGCIHSVALKREDMV